MKFKDLYLKGLDRTVNPAVSASDLDEETIKVEINEYVFTNEIINNIYAILSNIRKNKGSHTGIWINGYYGSGKSHFLKYVNYCLSRTHGAEALSRLREAVAEREPMELDVEIGEMDDLIRWFTTEANIDSVMFNIGTVHDANSDQKAVFTQVFWNEFNGMRGLNKSHLALAQYLEKALEDDGKFEEFISYVKEQGYDWYRNIHRFSGSKLDLALEMAKQVDPHLSIDVIRERIKNNDVNISVESFANELQEYIEQKNDKNYRIVFFIDEVSQFIDGRTEVLLQLQEIVTRVCEVCKSQVWFACTAQQDLTEVIQSCNIAETNENYGKIMGRFEVRASLQGTSPEYITQKRILDKKGDVEIDLENMYAKEKAKLDAQFILPSTYQAFKSKEDFAGYYPFVPYQFQLIMKVLDSFTKMNYVDRQVKGNERSLINITYSIAKETADMNVGEFIPFDKFFNAMFQGSMQHMGQRALSNARAALDLIQDKEKHDFYQRVVFVLFMVCNLAEEDKQQFSANIDNIVTLLMSKVDASKAAIKHDVSEVLEFLMAKAVIRKVTTSSGNEVYEFYTEEESKVAQIINNQKVDTDTYREELKKIIYSYFGNPNNKEIYATRSFSVGIDIEGRNFLSSNPDIMVDFVLSSPLDTPEEYSFHNDPKHLVFFLASLFNEEHELRNNFHYYCRVQSFMKNGSVSEEREKIKQIFTDRAKELYKRDIEPKFFEIFERCPVISGTHKLSSHEMGTAKKADKYKEMILYHLKNLYPNAQMVNNAAIPRNATDLFKKIIRPLESTLMDSPLYDYEIKVKEAIERAGHDITVADLTSRFEKVPYGWSETATAYIINELVRRQLYQFEYNRSKDVEKTFIAQNILKDQSKFSIVKATAIPQETINQFISSWKKIFNVMMVNGANDSGELYRSCREDDSSEMNQLIQDYTKLYRSVLSTPFACKIEEALNLLNNWAAIRDHKKFFETIINAESEAVKLLDECKNIADFHSEQYDKYKTLISFIESNKDNVTFLSDEQQQSAEKLTDLLADTEPWTRMPSYLKIMKTVDAQLKERKKELIDSITRIYNEKFDELEKYALKVNVPLTKFENRDTYIASLVSSDNFYKLRDAKNNDSSFYEEQLGRINNCIPQAVVEPPKTADTPSDNGEDVPPAPVVPPTVRKRRVVHLRTHTSTPLVTEQDVDNYLKTLKDQLMKQISDDEEIIIG